MQGLSSSVRRYGFACSGCRRKKVRCDGARPTCRNCERGGIQCVYNPESGDVRLLQKLENANKRVLELEEQVKALALANSDDRDKLRIGTNPSDNGLSPNSMVSLSSPSNRTGVNDFSDDEDTQENALAELSVDEHGRVQYFGATSRFYVAPEQGCEQPQKGSMLEHSSEAIDDSGHKSWLLSSSKLQKSWERLAFANLQTESDVNPQLSSDLLQIYWTWQHPLHNCVYRPCFTRDMAHGGPYFSKFLLYTLYAHASRHANVFAPRFKEVGDGERFLAKAKLLLQSEMEQPRPKIPTIQALLILGGRQCAIGKHSEGWLYTGMAIRMMKDIGLHFDMRKLADLEKLAPEDLEARKRLFLSAYAWDKSISICLGRPPSLTEMPYTPDSLSDHSDDDELWRPCFLPDENSYPPTKSFSTQTFIGFCRLAQLINESYNIVYNGKTRTNLLANRIIYLEDKVRKFYRSLPDPLRIENISSLQFCPPPHIFSLNILYHVTLILLYRPFLFYSTSSRVMGQEFHTRAHRICVEETSKVNEFVRAHRRTFNFRILTYLVSYCVYTAATIDVCEIESDDETAAAAAAQRLSVTLRMLESEARQTPGIKRSIEIIKTQLRTHSEPLHGGGFQGAVGGGNHATKILNTKAPDGGSFFPPQSRQNIVPAEDRMLPTGVQRTAPEPPFHLSPFASSTTTRQHVSNTEQQHPGISSIPSTTYFNNHLQGHSNNPSQSFNQHRIDSSIAAQFEMAAPADSTNQLHHWPEPEIWNASGGFVPGVLNWNMQQDKGGEEGGDFASVNTFWSSSDAMR